MSAANGAISPTGDRHPGDIVQTDHVEARQWTVRAEEVPQSVAWVEVGDRWHPVIRIEITGNSERREISKFGPGGEFLESTVQAPRPARGPTSPTPQPTPEPEP